MDGANRNRESYWRRCKMGPALRVADANYFHEEIWPKIEWGILTQADVDKLVASKFMDWAGWPGTDLYQNGYKEAFIKWLGKQVGPMVLNKEIFPKFQVLTLSSLPSVGDHFWYWDRRARKAWNKFLKRLVKISTSFELLRNFVNSLEELLLDRTDLYIAIKGGKFAQFDWEKFMLENFQPRYDPAVHTDIAASETFTDSLDPSIVRFRLIPEALYERLFNEVFDLMDEHAQYVRQELIAEAHNLERRQGLPGLWDDYMKAYKEFAATAVVGTTVDLENVRSDEIFYHGTLARQIMSVAESFSLRKVAIGLVEGAEERIKKAG